jgi:asparagine synthase (glutamine-hydrolysing)
MSGIAGIIHFDGKPVEPGLIEKMTGAMAHRGPDGIHHWVKGSVALGQCMLRTTPESLEEHQPLTNEDESLALVMDGRVDNWEELRRELLGRGAVLRNRSDAELVLRAYEVWGEECPLQLLGEFAFAIWDGRRQRVFLARDHIGVKPFYYFDGSDYLAFASDEEAFLGMPGVSRDLNEDFIAANLLPQFHGGDFNRGWLADILKLPPGNTLTAQRSGHKFMRSYWQLQPIEESRFGSDQECEEAFRSVFGEAVRCRMRILGHPALMLSGGIDSASVAAMARATLPEMPSRELHAYSAVADDPASCAESRNIQAICAGYERQAHWVSLPSLRGCITDEDLQDAAWTHAHPVGNSILLPAMMYLAARRGGHRVMFDGIDGDLVTYTPVRYMTSLLRSGAWRDAWAEAQQASINNTYLQGMSPLIIFAGSAWETYAPNAVKSLKQRIWNIRGRNPFQGSLINRQFAADIRLGERLRTQHSQAQMVSLLSDQERHIHVLAPSGIASGMEGFDAVAARYGVEPRHPWSDRRLVEFYRCLPLQFKVRDGWTKYLVRKTLVPPLDSGVAWHRGKGHLGMQLVRHFMEQSPEQVHGALRNQERVIEKYVDREVLHTLLDHNCRSATDTADTEIYKLYKAASLAQWLNRVRLAA